MEQTIIEKILSSHSGHSVKPGDIADVEIDVRVARDFGGANVVKSLEAAGLGIADPARTFFTFDCNPCGSDQKYAANQQFCRLFARKHGIRIYDIDSGIGTHLAIDAGLIGPGGTLVSTDSHANILGAIGAFGQGMGDQDIAHAFAFGRTWFEVPKSLRIVLKGEPGPQATAKDLVLALLRRFGANGLLDYSAELYGDCVDRLNMDERITVASMATEMAGIILFIPPSPEVVEYCRERTAQDKRGHPSEGCPLLSAESVPADPDARYDREEVIDVSGLAPLISRPGHPEDVVPVSEVHGRKIDSAFIGSCTNGRFSDLKAAADILRGRRVAPGVVLKIVPATDRIWRQCLEAGLIEAFKQAGALVGNAGCAGCAAGQIGQNGPQEVTVSTGNRNFAGKQGAGEVYLASPATVASSALAGVITSADRIPIEPVKFAAPPDAKSPEPQNSSFGVRLRHRPGRRDSWFEQRATGYESRATTNELPATRPTAVRGRVWVIRQDNIDTDMIYHNRYLAITKLAEMGQYTFVNLKGWDDFAEKAKPGDIVVTGKNFGAGSSRQQAVDCFVSLGIAAIVAESFGAIYKRNAINAGLPIVTADTSAVDLKDGDDVELDFAAGRISILRTGASVRSQSFSEVQMSIYQRGGLLRKEPQISAGGRQTYQMSN
jgi:3-isopropylmalate dehydratase small subunit